MKKFAALATAAAVMIGSTNVYAGSVPAAKETTTETAVETTAESASENATENTAETTDDTAAQELDAMNVTKVDDFLYTINLNDYDLATGEAAKSSTMKAAGGCASVVSGNLMGRNLDWSYNHWAYFVYRTEAAEGRHASIGMTGFNSTLTDDVADKIVAGDTSYNDALKSLAYTTLDGVNDAGLAATVLVVPTGAEGITTGTNEGADDLFAGMVVREVLDQCSSVDEAVALVKSRNLYAANSDLMKQEFHWRFFDKDKTVIVEAVNNEISVLEGEDVVTNFYLTGFDKTEKTLPAYPEGIERYNILKDNYDKADSIDGMMNLMKMVNFSKCYDLNNKPFWYSEFCGNFGDDSYGNLTSAEFGDKDLSDGDLSKAGAYEKIISDKTAVYNKGRAAAGEESAWITCYTSVYDIENLTLTVSPQETDNVYTFQL